MTFLPDINIWLALTLDLHMHHARAAEWVQGPGVQAVFCRASQQGLFRLLTTGVVMERYVVQPLTNKEAWAVYDAYLADYRISHCDEPEELRSTWRHFASQGTSSPKMWMDAYLAAYAVVGEYRMVTTDTAFRQRKKLDLLVIG